MSNHDDVSLTFLLVVLLNGGRVPKGSNTRREDAMECNNISWYRGHMMGTRMVY